MSRQSLYILIFLITAGCCREDCADTYIISGTVENSNNGDPCVGFEIELEEMVMEGGVLNGFYESIVTTTTDASGFYYIEFPRKQALSYRIGILEDGWFPVLDEIEPNLFTPDVPFDYNIITTPKADLDISVFNAPPSNEIDKMIVRLLKTFDEYSSCDAEWRVFIGVDIDTTWSCILPGNVWMPYMTIDQTDPENEITTIDSVYCTSFGQATINVVY